MPLPLSHTRIEAWESCPLYFRSLYIDKMPITKTPPLMVGGLFHDWAQLYVRHLQKTKQQTDMAFGAEAFETLWENRANKKDYKTLPERFYQDLKKMVDLFLKDQVFTPDTIGAVEMELAFNTKWEPVEWMAPDVFFRLKIDRIDVEDGEDGKKIATITDYKTSWAAEGEEQMPSNAQLKRYVFGASRIMKEHRFRVALHYVRWGYMRVIDMDVAEAEKEQKRIEAVSRQVEKAYRDKMFIATPGVSCGYCPKFETCPARTEAEPFRAVTDEATAVQALQRLIMLDLERGKIAEALKGFTGVSGVVKTGGLQYGPNRRRELTYNLSDVESWMASFGLKHPGIFKVSNDEMRKLLSGLEKSRSEDASAALAKVPEPDVKMTTEYRLVKEKPE